MKQVLEKLVKEAIFTEWSDLSEPDVFNVTVSEPPRPEMGDYATNAAMVVAKKVGQSPVAVAEQLVAAIKKATPIDFLEAVGGGFINFFLKPELWFKEVLDSIGKAAEDYGKTVLEHPEKVMVEYLSPNTNKPLHLGHLRNGITGVAVINALVAAGQTVIKTAIINDRGVHICKAMLAYQRWGEGATPESASQKPDYFVGEWYVRFAREAAQDPSLQDQAQVMLQKWEEGDVEVRALWAKMRQWVLDGWQQTEEMLGFTFDKVYFESEVFQLGKDIVADGLASGVLRKTLQGNVVFDLPVGDFGTDEAGNARMLTVLRPDGTSLYTTQDLGLAVQRVREFHLDRLIYVVGSEQRFHFQSLFAMLETLGYKWAQKLYHLWYAMVYLPEGKMKSREGTVVDADDLVAQMTELARGEIVSRLPAAELRISDLEIMRRAKIIALGAIKFYILKPKPTTDIYFDPKASIAFEGQTGPYCQYTYARARSIIRIAQSGALEPAASIEYELLGEPEERGLLQKLELFPEVVRRSAAEYNPALVATHVFETAQAFNAFYTSHPVIKAETISLRYARLVLVKATAQVIHNGLVILGIETLEEM